MSSRACEFACAYELSVSSRACEFVCAYELSVSSRACEHLSVRLCVCEFLSGSVSPHLRVGDFVPPSPHLSALRCP